LQQQYAPRLRHGLYDQNARHDGLAGEMALKEAFIDGDVLYSYNPLPSFHFFDGIDQQKWIAMWENLLDPVTVEDHRCPQISVLFPRAGYSRMFPHRAIRRFYTKQERF
jgi:hypothetical protein